MHKKAISLDIDPSIIEKQLFLDNNGGDFQIHDEFQKYFRSENEPPSVTFKPSPGFCVKTHSKADTKKVFINVCHTDKIPQPKELSDSELIELLQSDESASYRVPMSIGNPRTEATKSGDSATAYDVAINTKFFEKLLKSEVFHSFFIAVVFEGVQDKFQVEFDMENFVVLKNRRCLGELQMHKVVQREIQNVQSPFIEEVSNDQEKKDLNNTKEIDKNKINEQQNKKANDLKYTLKRINEDGKMKYLLGEFHMDTMVSLCDLIVDVGEDRIVVETKSNLLDIFVPCLINKNNVKAVLDQNTGILHLKMAVKSQ